MFNIFCIFDVSIGHPASVFKRYVRSLCLRDDGKFITRSRAKSHSSWVPHLKTGQMYWLGTLYKKIFHLNGFLIHMVLFHIILTDYHHRDFLDPSISCMLLEPPQCMVHNQRDTKMFLQVIVDFLSILLHFLLLAIQVLHTVASIELKRISLRRIINVNFLWILNGYHHGYHYVFFF